MILKVVSKRTDKNNYLVNETSVVNKETGEALEGVVGVTWEVGYDGIPYAVIIVVGVEADIEGDFEVQNA